MGNVSANSQTFPLGLPRRESFDPTGWSKLATFLTVGYLCMGRSFAYLGLPWFSLYIGELALGAFLLFGPRTKQGRWLQIAQRVRRLRHIEWVLLLLLCYGGFEALRGILKGYPAFTALRDTAFDYYSLYLFLGVWAGLKGEDFLRRLVRLLAWWNGCYGLAYVLVLNWLPWAMPGTAGAAKAVPLFSEPYNGSAIALLAMLAFEPRLRKVWYLVAMNAFVLLGLQVRSEWVGFAAGLLVFALLTRRFKQLAVASGLVLLLLGVMYATNLTVLSPKHRGGSVGTEISADSLIARALAPLSKSLALRLAPAGDVGFAASTAEWRLVWWARIWVRANSSQRTALLGFGYGYPIGALNPFIPEGRFIQTPHNDFFYALGFTGWLGVALFAFLQLEIVRLLFRSYRTNGQPFGLMCWSAYLASAMFTEVLEGPFGAIPFYLLVGAAIAPALLARKGELARPSALGSVSRAAAEGKA